MRSSPTKIPPVSSGAFQVSPKSLRLVLAVADIQSGYSHMGLSLLPIAPPPPTEVGAFEMGVLGVFEGTNRTRIDLHFDLLMPPHFANRRRRHLEHCQRTAHSHHHVTDAELRTRVRGIDLVICKHEILLLPSERCRNVSRCRDSRCLRFTRSLRSFRPERWTPCSGALRQYLRAEKSG